MNDKTYTKLHKKTTGFKLRGEQIIGTKNEFAGKTKAQLLAEIKAHDEKYYGKK